MGLPSLKIEKLILNPVHPDYFYLIKFQGIENDMIINNFVLKEDYEKLQSKVDEAKNEIVEVDEESKDGLNASILR